MSVAVRFASRPKQGKSLRSYNLKSKNAKLRYNGPRLHDLSHVVDAKTTVR
jgi:hypothetical protein